MPRSSDRSTSSRSASSGRTGSSAGCWTGSEESRSSAGAEYGVTLVASTVPGVAADGTAIIEHVKTRLASYKAPRRVVFVEQFYRSPSGKADYRWAKQVAADGAG